MTGPLLVCFDRSSGSHHAIEHAAAMFPGAPTVVLNLWELPLELPAPRAEGSSAREDGRRAAAEEIAAEGCTRARQAGLDARPMTACGSIDGIWRTILELGDELDARVVVIGARGLGALRSMLLGSVSREVVQHARRPVLVVPPAVAGAS